MFNSCTNREETITCFPDEIIDVQLNLNLPAYQSLQYTGGWMYIDEQQSGSKGLILVNSTSGFIAYDRNAPHLCPENTTQLKVKNDIKIICPKDNAEWILLTGEPIAVTAIAPKKYYVQYDLGANILIISN